MQKKPSKKEEHGHHHGSDWLSVRGARTHNLKNIDVEMPRGAMTVITGLSGSGKSSLAFDTIFAEGQRRYVESLSAYARQFLNQMPKPDVDEITGLSPAISIDQKSRSNNPRSTVATVTEIYDYLRVLYARVGQPYCVNHDVPITRLSKEEMIKMVFARVEAKRKESGTQVMGVAVDKSAVTVYAPVVVGRKGEYYQLLYDLLGKGFEKVVIDGKQQSLREKVILDRNKRHDIDAVVDSIYVSEFARSTQNARERLSEALELALKEADGLVKIKHADGTLETLSSKFICPDDGSSFPEVEPRLFSFNSPYGACPACNGLGTKSLFSEEPCPVCEGKRLRPEALRVYLKGDSEKSDFKNSKKSDFSESPLGKNIVDFTSMSIREAKDFVDSLELSEMKREVAAPILKEIGSRLSFMLDVGLDYLTLDRSAATLSGGEAQRIRLASQLGSGLTGALYVLDEPTIGLHQRDNDRLIKTLLTLKELGNTIIVVEHDEDTIYSADYIVDVGPGAGVHGGHVVVSGWLGDLLTAKKNESGSSTLSYLRQEKEISVPETRRTAERGWLKVRGATLHNLVNQNIDIPLGKLVAITGVSGSGKSTFLYDILHRNLVKRTNDRLKSWRKKDAQLEHVASLTGSEYAGRVVLIDQSPIGRTPRSNPATYTGAMTHIRDLFAATSEARARGWKPGRFSFNVPGGRCEACQGNGVVAVEMHFLPTVYVTCDVCEGKRFMKETLEVTYRGKNIYEVLQMTVEEAEQFFADIPAIQERLAQLNATGLEYLTLGQSATTLSGGEAQRVKIAAELYRPTTMKTIYLLDEPTVGLHYDDVKKLIEILQELVARGNTVVVIEHNLDVIKSADYIIDFGPEGGAGGGKVVAKGTPEEVTASGTYTGDYLARVLKRHAKKRSK